MSAVAEARALLARQQEREREALARAAERDELPWRPVLDMPPALLVRLCDEIDALRAADVAHEQRHALSERGDGYADRVIAELRAERDALREYYEATMDARAVGVTLTPPYGLTPPAVTPEVQRAAAARLRAALDALAAKGEG